MRTLTLSDETVSNLLSACARASIAEEDDAKRSERIAELVGGLNPEAAAALRAEAVRARCEAQRFQRAMQAVLRGEDSAPAAKSSAPPSAAPFGPRQMAGLAAFIDAPTRGDEEADARAALEARDKAVAPFDRGEGKPSTSGGDA